MTELTSRKNRAKQKSAPYISEARFTRVRTAECKTCAMVGPSYQVKDYQNKEEAEAETDSDILAGIRWDGDHARVHGHKKFWYYTFERASGEVFIF